MYKRFANMFGQTRIVKRKSIAIYMSKITSQPSKLFAMNRIDVSKMSPENERDSQVRDNGPENRPNNIQDSPPQSPVNMPTQPEIGDLPIGLDDTGAREGNYAGCDDFANSREAIGEVIGGGSGSMGGQVRDLARAVADMRIAVEEVNEFAGYFCPCWAGKGS